MGDYLRPRVARVPESPGFSPECLGIAGFLALRVATGGNPADSETHTAHSRGRSPFLGHVLLAGLLNNEGVYEARLNLYVLEPSAHRDLLFLGQAYELVFGQLDA